MVKVGDTIVARTGDPAPGLPGLTLGSVSVKDINSSGQVVYTSSLTGPGVTSTNFLAIFGPSGLIARMGDPAPDVSGARYRSFFGTARIDDNGGVAFHAYLEGGVAPFNSPAIFGQSGSGPTELIIRAHQPAPNGAVYTDINPYFELTGSGEVGFRGQLAFDPENPTANREGYFTLDGPVFQPGDPIPGFDRDVSITSVYAANDNFDLAFRGTYQDDGGINRNGIFTDKGVVALHGDKAPGTGDGVSYFQVSALDTQIGNAGDVVFAAFLTGPNGVSIGNRFLGQSLFWAGPDGTVYDLMIAGQFLDLGDGIMREVHRSNMRRQGISDWGVSFITHFTDGSQAIFRASSPWETFSPPSQVPAPTSAVLLLFGLLALGVARHCSAPKQR
ncbi:MAG: hypothetical protein JJT88_00540 [Gammaproteobacteria bacterium]|nr:hypothetical protein [Gammaproteobacteria bacterium]